MDIERSDNIVARCSPFFYDSHADHALSSCFDTMPYILLSKLALKIH